MGYVAPNSEIEGGAKITQTVKVVNAVQEEDSVGMTPATVTVNGPSSQHQKHHLNPLFKMIFQRNLRAPRGSNLSQSVAVKSALDKRMAEENFKRQAAELR